MASILDDIQLLKNTKIAVYVDEVLPDIIVVTFEFGLQIFKGVLLDSTKRNLPCGVPNLNPAFTKKPDDDPLYAANQRFAYLDPNAPRPKKVQLGNRYKSSKMTVRLRPRQVLCSKCKGICNENSENVSRKRKAVDKNSPPPPPPPSRRSSAAPITRSVNSYLNSNNNKLSNTRKKLRSSNSIDDNKVAKGSSKRVSSEENNSEDQNWQSEDPKKPVLSSVFINMDETPLDPPANSKHSCEHSDPLGSDLLSEPPKLTPTQSLRAARRTVRKKRNTESTETPWSEENPEKTTSTIGDTTSSTGAANNVVTNTRTIKISYGPQGEGTVLKIPAQIDDVNMENTEFSAPTMSVNDEKAARRALKRARKEARRKIMLGGASPRYGIGGSSPRYTVGSASPRQGLGNNSPRYIMPSFDLSLPRRRRHKVKHKKKHKEDKDRNRYNQEEGEVSSSTQEETKEQCITQKLSINLKRLTTDETYSASQEDSSSSEEHSGGEQIPDFPQGNSPMVLRTDAIKLTSALGADGVRLFIGDVVWGKLQGFPWWPGKILSISSCSAAGQGLPLPHAHVAWYASTTSSVIQCDQLCHYLDSFKVRYNKKKKGIYREAVKQATLEAQENAENRIRQPLGNSPSHNIIHVVPPALASPREIDVAS